MLVKNRLIYFVANILKIRGFSEMSKVRPLIFCGPSGSGKSSLVKKMMAEFPDKFGFCTSYTTRKPRPGEENGKDYNFVDIETMKKGIKEGWFIESAMYGDNYYGTSKNAVEDICKQGTVCILDIDIQGLMQVKDSNLDPWCVFVKPPSLDVLRQRLRDRKTETMDTLRLRLGRAEREMEYGTTPGNFQLVIVNDDLERAYADLRDFIVNNVLANKS